MATGLDCYLYVNTGTYSSPTWTLAANVKDLQKTGDTGKADGSSRASRWKSYERTLKDLSLSFGYVKKTSDATMYALFRTNWLTDVDMDVAIADGPIATTGTKYIRAQVGIFKWEEAEPLENVVMAQIEMHLIDAITHPPAITTVA